MLESSAWPPYLKHAQVQNPGRFLSAGTLPARSGLGGAYQRNAAKFWLTRQGQRWRERRQVEVSDPPASQSPEQRLAGVIELGPALLDAAPDDDGGNGCRLLGDWGLRSAAVLAYWCRPAENPRRFLEGRGAP